MALLTKQMSSKQKQREAYNRIAKVMDVLTKEECDKVMYALSYERIRPRGVNAG